MAIDGEYVYFIPDDKEEESFNAKRFITKFIDAAKDESFGSTPVASYISGGNAAGMAVRIPNEARREARGAGLPSQFANLLNSVICMKGGIEGDRMVVDIKIFDEDGKALDSSAFAKYFNVNAKVNTDALKYMSKDEYFVYAASIQDVDWDNVIDKMTNAARLSRAQRSQISIATSYLEKINGTIAYGLGYTGDLSSLRTMRTPLENLSFTAVVETKDGKARGILNDIKGFLETAGMTYSEVGEGIKINISSNPADGSIYCGVDGNFIIFSNHSIAKTDASPAVKAFNFSDYIAGACIVLDKHLPLISDFGIQSTIKSSIASNAEDMEARWVVELSSGPREGFVARLAQTIFAIIYKTKENVGRYDDVSAPDDYYPYEEVVEEVVVVEADSVAY